MAITLHTLRRGQLRKGKKRLGRGNASGTGTYAGRGLKGQKARSGGRRGLKRRGLKQYLMQIPKSRGFKRPKTVVAITLGSLSQSFKEGDHVTIKALVSLGMLKPGKKVKIVKTGTLKKKLSITVHEASKGAIEAIKKSGGTIHLTPRA